MSERYEVGTTGAASVATDDMTQSAAGRHGEQDLDRQHVRSRRRPPGVVQRRQRRTGRQPHRSRLAPRRHGYARGDRDRRRLGRGQRPVSALACERGDVDDIGPTDTTSPYYGLLRHDRGRRRALRPSRRDHGCGVQRDQLDVVEDRRVDNTAPSPTTTFPASAATYNAAGWDGGLRHGRALRHVLRLPARASPRCRSRCARARATTGTAPRFSSGAEVWNTASLSAATGRTHSRRRASRPTEATPSGCARPTGPATSRRRSSRTFTIDRRRRRRRSTRIRSNPTGSTSADFGFSSSEGGSTFECRLDGGAWARVHQPEELHEPHRRQPHLRRTRHRRRGQPGRLARPRTPGWSTRRRRARPPPSRPRAASTTRPAGPPAARTAGLCGTYSDGDRLRRRAGAGLHPPGRGQLLERLDLRERHRGLEHAPLSRPATGRTRSRPAASPPTATTRCACARSTPSRTRRRRRAGPSRTTRRIRARSSPSPPRAATTRTRPGTPAVRRAASAARTPTRSPESRASRSRSSASRPASTGTASSFARRRRDLPRRRRSPAATGR